MQAKDYQKDVLESVDAYLRILREEQERSEKVRALVEADPDLGLEVPDFTAKSWDRLAKEHKVGRELPYSPRQDGIGRPVPNATLKIPTGGGKTFLAVQSITRIIGQYFEEGSPQLVLYIVPSEAIYSQTKRALTNREGALRKALDVASGNRVKILEKDSPLHADDLEANLCVMLLMLPSANRVSKETLKIFRDRGNVNGFLPPDDDRLAHEALLRQVPNLDYIKQGDLLTGEERPDAVGLIKSSLGNALRLCRPLIVMDEGQKGFSALASETLYGFNPRFVLELSATAEARNAVKHFNWLVNVKGEDLEKAEMIKMPIQLTTLEDQNWRDCLRDAWLKTEDLRVKAEEFRHSSLRYIRPILLVQVERVGKDQIGTDFIHADQAREHLIGLGVEARAIAIKTSEQDDLKELENRNLLEERNPIRVIITKQALQEGWDCPFAYVLCSLAASRSVSAMTQLVGRILRQPGAAKTGVEELDRCYVYTFKQSTGEIVNKIKDELENEGMGDLAGRVVSSDGSSTGGPETVIRKRKFAQGKKLYLPQVLKNLGEGVTRELDWETDILGAVDWPSFRVGLPEGGLKPGDAQSRGGTSEIDLSVLRLGTARKVSEQRYATEFNLAFATRDLCDLIPNPFIAYRVVSDFVELLKESGWTDRELGENQPYVLSSLKLEVSKKLDEELRRVYDAGMESGEILFDLVLEKSYLLPDTSPVEKGRVAVRSDDHSPIQKSLFDPVYEKELNCLELSVATFIDKKEAIWFWMRNSVRGRAYGLQGWRRTPKVFPDLIVAKERDGEVDKWVVLETKGMHLVGNPDSEYKQKLMDRLSEIYVSENSGKVGQLTIMEGRASYSCALIREDSWEARLNELL